MKDRTYWIVYLTYIATLLVMYIIPNFETPRLIVTSTALIILLIWFLKFRYDQRKRIKKLEKEEKIDNLSIGDLDGEHMRYL